jgi:hypothetical protein
MPLPVRLNHVHSLTRSFDATQSQYCKAVPREEKADQDEDDDEEYEEEERNDDPSLRSLMMGMMNEMREMRLENARLHNTIADLCARQAHTESELAALKMECQPKPRRLEEAATQHPVTAGASAPTELGMMTARISNIINNKRYRYHNEVEEFIRHNLPYLAGYDLAALIIKDLTYALSFMCVQPQTLTERCAFVCGGALDKIPWMVYRLSEIHTLEEMVKPVNVYVSPAMCRLLGYAAVRAPLFSSYPHHHPIARDDVVAALLSP